MAITDVIEDDVDAILAQPWAKQTGNSVPSTAAVPLYGGAVELQATFLYADLADSSRMVKELDRRVAAKILKSFHTTTCRLIKLHGGSIVSFDGDRVMGVFVGTEKNSSAAICALNINYAVSEVIRPKFESTYESVRSASFTIGHGVGVDVGTVLAVRAGVRGDNDLVWIGRAPNLAAKLSDLRDAPYNTHISGSVYASLDGSATLSNKDGSNMWVRTSRAFLGQSLELYRSSWWRAP